MRNENPDLKSLAASQCAAHRCEDAISLLEASLVRHPCDAALSHQIGRCYSGACRAHCLVSLPIAIAYFERSLSIIGPSGNSEFRARLLDSLANARRCHRQPEDALPLFEQAAQLFQSLGKSEDWARTEFNLGNLCCNLAEGGVLSFWETAIRHYLNALTVRREKVDPVRFAATAQNLGTAFRGALGEDRAGNLKKAIGCYYAAFRAYSGAHMLKQCADLHNNLGNAFLELPSPPNANCQNTRQALRHFAIALRVRTKSDHPCEYAVTQFNRGQGYLLLAPCDPAGAVRSAIACFQEALDGFLLGGDASGAEMVRRRLSSLQPQAPTTPPHRNLVAGRLPR